MCKDIYEWEVLSEVPSKKFESVLVSDIKAKKTQILWMHLKYIRKFSTHQKIKILYPMIPLKREDNYMLKGFYCSEDPKKYQVFNFLLWIADIHLFGLLPEKFYQNKHRNYCYKLVARAAAFIWRWPTGRSTDKVPLDAINTNPYYVTKPDWL